MPGPVGSGAAGSGSAGSVHSETECAETGQADADPKLFGKLKISIEAGSRAAIALGATEIHEQFTCSYELNPIYEDRIDAGGLRIAGRGENGEARVVEIPDHPFFIATLFVPQYSSIPDAPHPLVSAFIAAALERRRNAETRA